MRPLTPLLTAALALALALPVTSSALLPQSNACANDGVTRAGTPFPPRSPPSLPTHWCIPFTSTYLLIQTFIPASLPPPLGAATITTTLTSALASAQSHIGAYGDGVIEAGVFEYADEAAGWSWYAVNAGNHQLTWGVVAAAVKGLRAWMQRYGEYGTAGFGIWDGNNMVGLGSFGPTRV